MVTIIQDTTTTDVQELLEDLDGGTFSQNLGKALSKVALGVVTHSKEGEITIKMKLKQIGETTQVNIEHTLGMLVPTKYGKQTDSSTKHTPMHVGVGGKMTLLPNGNLPGNQRNMFDRKGDVDNA